MSADFIIPESANLKCKKLLTLPRKKLISHIEKTEGNSDRINQKAVYEFEFFHKRLFRIKSVIIIVKIPIDFF